MATHNGQTMDAMRDQLSERMYDQGLSVNYGSAPPQWQTETLAELLETFLSAEHSVENKAAQPASTFGAQVMDTPREDFFERMIVLPRKIDAGVVLATVVFEFTVYSAFRTATHSLDAVVSTVGGLVFEDLPALPKTMPPQDGFVVTVDILEEGPPVIDGDIQWIFDVETVFTPVTGSRSVLFPFQPEAPVVETLVFLTDVIARRDGGEQRVALRQVPRQVFDMAYSLDGRERQFFNSVLFASQGRALGVPVWYEQTLLAAPASVTDTEITVESTADLGFEPGELAVIFNDPFDHLLLQIDEVTTTTISFTSEVTRPFEAGALVMPVRLCYALSDAGGQKKILNLQETKMRFTSIDSDSDLSDDSGWSTFGGKILLSDPNMVDGDLPEQFSQDLVVVDNGSGAIQAFTDQLVSRRSHPKKFFSNTPASRQKIRKLLHHLKGRLTSFYIPSFFPDLNPTAGISSGSAVLTFENVGYDKYVQGRVPMDVVRVLFTDGTSVVRQVIATNEIDEDEEQLTVSVNWGTTKTLEEIDRVELVSKVRADSDSIEIRHHDASGQATVTVPLISVVE